MADEDLRHRLLRQMLLLLLFLSPCLSAVSATVTLSEYQKQEWQVEDGLPQSELRAITQVPGGRLLMWMVSSPEDSQAYASPCSGGRTRM